MRARLIDGDGDDSEVSRLLKEEVGAETEAGVEKDSDCEGPNRVNKALS